MDSDDDVGSSLLGNRGSGRAAGDAQPGLYTRARALLHRAFGPWLERPAPPPQSAYLTLIPLSDSRLQPRRTRLTVALIACLCVLFSSIVFVLVPRGVTVGKIRVHSSDVTFNRTASTYQVVLTTHVEIHNPNFLAVGISGTINVSFYDQQAGSTRLSVQTIPARAQPEVLRLKLDASRVPKAYLLTIYTQCFTFPEQLIFFLAGSLEATYLGHTYQIPQLDTYFIIPCNETASDSTRDRGRRRMSSWALLGSAGRTRDWPNHAL